MDSADTRFSAQRELAALCQSQDQLVSFMQTLDTRLSTPQATESTNVTQLAELRLEFSRQHETQARLLDYVTSVDDRLTKVQHPTLEPTMRHCPPRHCKPPRYYGDPKLCRGFLNLCLLHFRFLPQHFQTDMAKVAFLASHLEGEALAWFNPLMERNDPIVSDLQGSLSVGQYAIRFRTLASELQWTNEPLVGVFRRGLSGRVKDELAGRDLPETLDDLISLAIRIDMRLQQRSRERLLEKQFPHPASSSPKPRFPCPAPVFKDVPMELDHVKVKRNQQEEIPTRNPYRYGGRSTSGQCSGTEWSEELFHLGQVFRGCASTNLFWIGGLEMSFDGVSLVTNTASYQYGLVLPHGLRQLYPGYRLPTGPSQMYSTRGKPRHFHHTGLMIAPSILSLDLLRLEVGSTLFLLLRLKPCPITSRRIWLEGLSRSPPPQLELGSSSSRRKMGLFTHASTTVVST
ncbi:uncharacterized protein [Ranitomeya imitator]|uniref:uncharacterized protein isoform X2 n=1 Tax=Ranitomeya imitator TaxID=111125 RepID=UPI0037E7FA0C